MKITQSDNKNLIATLSVEIQENDYNEKVEKTLADYRKNMQMPGFRKGKTPAMVIAKKYKTAVIMEKVNELIQDELYKYITENKLKVLGSPMPLQMQKVIDWKMDVDFNFDFEVGLAPEFDLNITKEDNLDYYIIRVDDKLLETYCNDVAKRYGKIDSTENAEEGDLIFCRIEQLDVNGNIMDNGIKNDATVALDFIVDKNIRSQFFGTKKDDTIRVNVMKAFTNHADLSAMLNISHEALHQLTSEEFLFTTISVRRLTPANLDIQLFDKIYGEGVVKSLDEFKTKLKQEAEKNFEMESNRMLKNDVVHYLLNKYQLALPEEFLKRWLVQSAEKPLSVDQVELEFPMYADSLKWQLIENKVFELFNINVSPEDAVAHTKELLKMQLMQYGQQEMEDGQLSDIANNVLKNTEERKKIYEQIFDIRTLAVYKENFKLKEKEVSYDEFVKLASEKTH